MYISIMLLKVFIRNFIAISFEPLIVVFTAVGFAALGIIMAFVFSNIGGTVLQVHV